MNRILFVLIVLFSIGCSRDKDETQYPATYPPQIIFDPSIEYFEGVPGDELNLKVNIEGKEENTFFNFLVLERSDSKTVSIDTLLFSEAGLLTPYPYEYKTILKEEDLENDFQLKFTVIRRVILSDVTSVYGTHSKNLTVRVKPKE